MYFDASYDTYKVPHAHSPKQRGKSAVTSNRVTKTSYHILAPAEPLGITPCCTLPRDKGDTFQANAQKAHSHLRVHVFLHMHTHLSCCTEMLKIVHDLYQNLITSNFDFVFKCFLWLTTPRFHTQKPRNNEEKAQLPATVFGSRRHIITFVMHVFWLCHWYYAPPLDTIQSQRYEGRPWGLVTSDSLPSRNATDTRIMGQP